LNFTQGEEKKEKQKTLEENTKTAMLLTTMSQQLTGVQGGESHLSDVVATSSKKAELSQNGTGPCVHLLKIDQKFTSNFIWRRIKKLT
jgi:hypothetical protein